MTEAGSPRIRTFSYHYRQKFGRSVGKIPLDVGVSCPNRERGGCIFCRPAGFTPHYLSKSDDLARQVAAGKAGLLQGRFRGYFAYFQQETCTAMPAERLLPLLREVLADPDCVGLILSTRPDCVDEALLLPLAELVTKSARECLFELGLQSVHERSLAFLNRNHGFADFCQAAERIRAAGSFQLGAHLIFGIPGETEEDMLASLAEVCRQGVTHLKLHHLQVIRETPLHDLYELGRVPVFSHGGYLDFLLRALPRIPADITIHRLWATAHPEYLVAPKWQILAGQLSRELLEKMAELGVWQGQLAVQDRMNGR
ncbi:MAG: TIGR01212 family radical SAM protein [Desulfobacterales bacterium GWB2_56_26]|nr:MAG: TIGR01212 family radical SAM protein [Desulfobacterales bacterium GWB2_56_26]